MVDKRPVRFIPAKPKLYPFAPRGEAMRAVMRSCAFVLAVNWLTQGMRGMDAKELVFRLLFELLLATGLFAVLAAMGAPAALLLSAFVAHSLNFTLNGQFWVCARYCPSYRGDPARLRRFMRGVARELSGRRSIDAAVAIGSLGGDTFGPRSDLDLRLVMAPGLRAWMAANLLLLRLRARAFLERIPLDAYAYAGVGSLERFEPDEPWVLLSDEHGRIARRFPARRLMSLS